MIADAAKRSGKQLHIPSGLKLPGRITPEPPAMSVQALLAMADLIGINCSLQRKEAFLDLMAKVFAADDR